ncbi:MAG: helicase-related protein, partial [Bacteroidota bacterium]|nr:helicase-related protein [Bacteroidota bacterium]
DTTSTKHSHQRILDQFRNENINILIGTQMIAKGLDFPNVTLVGVISADLSLNVDDFRASERTFQLLTQVAGRAGRGEKLGRVDVQTYQPDNFSVLSAKYHDYNTFYGGEIAIRKSLAYPPFSDIVSIIVSHNDNESAKKYTDEIESCIHEQFKKEFKQDEYNIYKTTPAPLPKINQMHRWRILIKVNNANSSVKNILNDIQKGFYTKANINIDINSNNML